MLRKLLLGLALCLGALSIDGRANAATGSGIQQFSNNGVTTLVASATSSATTITVASNATFPTLSSGNWFIATLEHLTAGLVTADEIIKVTADSSTTWTVVRAQEGTTGLSWSSGDTVTLLPTAGGLAQFVQPAQAQSQSYNYAAASVGGSNNYSVTLSPALVTHVIGMPITFKAPGSANTGSSTFNDGAGVGTIVQPYAAAALAAGDIPAGGMVTVVWDGTNFQLTSVSVAIANAVLLNPYGGAAQTITGPIILASTFPELFFSTTGAPTNQGLWLAATTSTQWALQALSDNESIVNNAILVNRVGDVITSVALAGTSQTGATQTSSDNSANFATTAFVKNVLAASPALGGVPTAPTASPSSTSTTQVASTAFVQSAIAAALVTGTVGTSGSITINVAGAPHGAVIIKWGFVTPGNTYTGSSTQPITFLTPFPNDIYFAAAFSNRNTKSTYGFGNIPYANLATNGFLAVLDADSSGNMSGEWIAIGD